MQDIQFLWDGGNTIRYHGIHTLVKDTVGHHSYNVACIIMHVRPDASAKLLRAALKHDAAEHKVGDMPAPTKRALPDYEFADNFDGSRPDLSFREVFGEYETKVAKNHGVDLEQDLDPADAWVLKFADALDGMRFCTQESHMGNNTDRLRGFYETFKYYVATLLFGEDRDGIIWHQAQLTKHAREEDRKLFLYLSSKWRSL